MRHRPELDLIAETYAQMAQSYAPGIAVVKVAPTSDMHGGLMDSSCGCEDDGHDFRDETDPSEIHMAKSQLRKAAEYAAKLSEMIDTLPSLEGWTASKITKASDYLSSVYHWLEYETSSDNRDDMFNCGYEDSECKYGDV